jgi:uncharacterized protein (TIGR03382 family)
MPMRRALLFILAMTGLAACEPASQEVERAARTESAFTSNESVLLDFDLDGSIVADADTDEPTLRTLIGAQLFYSVGALNADRSVGRYERLELSKIVRAPSGEVTYHAHLPVAWGRSGPAPSNYELRLPARASESDQTAFAAKYGETCVDAEAAGTGPIHPERMFLFYRPLRPGCVLDTSDVVTLSAKVTPSSENTTGKYPELDRIWDDGTLRAVVLFSRADAVEKSGTDDLGVLAFYELMTKTTEWAKTLAPTAMKTEGGNDGWTLSATLSDGRKVVVDARIVVPELAAESAAFDAWYDARTPEADLIMYSGHAGLGWNVRTLMNKGVFRAGKYVIWAVNGCDTFAYVDRTLATRRALLNADDPSGTKYMDVVSNVMAAWFHTGAETTVTLLDGLVSAPKPYRDMFASIDASQIVAVTGEEDNVFQPKPGATPSSDPYPKTVLPEEPNDDPPPGTKSGAAYEDDGSFRAGCSTAGRQRDGVGMFGAALLVASTLLVRRRNRTSKPLK